METTYAARFMLVATKMQEEANGTGRFLTVRLPKCYTFRWRYIMLALYSGFIGPTKVVLITRWGCLRLLRNQSIRVYRFVVTLFYCIYWSLSTDVSAVENIRAAENGKNWFNSRKKNRPTVEAINGCGYFCTKRGKVVSNDYSYWSRLFTSIFDLAIFYRFFTTVFINNIYHVIRKMTIPVYICLIYYFSVLSHIDRKQLSLFCLWNRK